MRQEYNKLVRDGIPKIIERSGRQYAVETMSEAEYWQALLAKLVEEASEVVDADSQSLISELADLYEVIEAVLATKGIPEEVVRQEQRKKQAERGGFEQRIRLLWVD
jgi:predicted house-cleaning noncanonical NTP pyrophosphatase (MazG superfamily)